MNTPNANTGSILIVDDMPANLELLADMLKSHGYKVRPAPSGRLALRAAKADPPEVVLLDINMPDINGFEVCRQFKQDDSLKDIPVLFLSARMETEDKIRAFNAGGVDYITKPFQIEEVLARIQTHLNLRMLRKQLEIQNTKLQETMDQLQAAQSQLIRSEKMAALGVLTAGIAHEINNPVNFIKTGVTGLENDFTELSTFVTICNQFYDHPAPATEHDRKIDPNTLRKDISLDDIMNEIPMLFRNIHEGIKRTVDIVNSLRILSRQDERRFTSVDIREMMRSALLVLKNRFRDIIEIEKRYPASIPSVSCMPGKIGQVLTNILSNAIDAILSKFNDETGGRIVIQIDSIERNDTPHIFFRINDNGAGISEEHLQSIFDPFFTTKEVGKGTGLGLYISHGIIEDHNGWIEVESVLGEGSTFTVFLPINQE